MIQTIDTSRRIAAVMITGELFQQMVRTGWKLPAKGRKSIGCVKGAPADAKWLGIGYDPASLSIYLYFEHPSFKIVLEGEVIPVLPITFESR